MGLSSAMKDPIVVYTHVGCSWSYSSRGNLNSEYPGTLDTQFSVVQHCILFKVKKKIKSKREKLRVVVLEPNKSSESSQNAKVKTVSVLMEVLVSNRFCYF